MNQRTLESCPEVVVYLGEKKPIRVLHVGDKLGLLKVAKQCLELQGPFQVDLRAIYCPTLLIMSDIRLDN